MAVSLTQSKLLYYILTKPYTYRNSSSSVTLLAEQRHSFCFPFRYADRARHIRNKPVVNRDPIAAQLATLRNTIAQLKGENVALRRALARAGGSEGAVTEALSGGGLGGGALDAVVERLQQENSSLEAENLRLKMDMVRMQLHFSNPNIERQSVWEGVGAVRGAGMSLRGSSICHHLATLIMVLPIALVGGPPA